MYAFWNMYLVIGGFLSKSNHFEKHYFSEEQSTRQAFPNIFLFHCDALYIFKIAPNFDNHELSTFRRAASAHTSHHKLCNS